MDIYLYSARLVAYSTILLYNLLILFVRNVLIIHFKSIDYV